MSITDIQKDPLLGCFRCAPRSDGQLYQKPPRLSDTRECACRLGEWKRTPRCRTGSGVLLFHFEWFLRDLPGYGDFSLDFGPLAGEVIRVYPPVLQEMHKRGQEIPNMNIIDEAFDSIAAPSI